MEEKRKPVCDWTDGAVMTPCAYAFRVGVLLAVMGLLSGGCGPMDVSGDPASEASSSGYETNTTAQSGNSLEQVLAGTAPPPPAADLAADVEPNDSFETAQPVEFTETVKISGEIDADVSPADRDVYDLGPSSAGDRVLADLTVASGSDVVLGLFDARGRILGYIDPSSLAAGPRQMDVVLREPAESLYAMVAARSTSPTARTYTASISVQRGVGSATEHPQLLVLNFEGTTGVRIGNRTPVDVPRFDVASIDGQYAGQTGTVVDLIVQKVRAQFAGLNVTVYRSDDPALPDGELSTIYYGTYDSRLLGLADNIDPYNAQPVQSAILYTDTFALFATLSPTLEQLAQVLANTTSHEAGHMLGLRHTADPTDLMDTTATARQMLLEQDFGVANLNASVIAVGQQDAPAMLAWAVGGQLLVTPKDKPAARQRAIGAASLPGDFYIPRNWLMDCPCSRCGQP